MVKNRFQLLLALLLIMFTIGCLFIVLFIISTDDVIIDDFAMEPGLQITNVYIETAIAETIAAKSSTPGLTTLESSAIN